MESNTSVAFFHDDSDNLYGSATCHFVTVDFHLAELTLGSGVVSPGAHLGLLAGPGSRRHELRMSSVLVPLSHLYRHALTMACVVA